MKSGSDSMDVEAAQELTLQNVLKEVKDALKDKASAFASLSASLEGLTTKLGGITVMQPVDTQHPIRMLH